MNRKFVESLKSKCLRMGARLEWYGKLFNRICQAWMCKIQKLLKNCWTVEASTWRLLDRFAARYWFKYFKIRAAFGTFFFFETTSKKPLCLSNLSVIGWPYTSLRVMTLRVFRYQQLICDASYHRQNCPVSRLYSFTETRSTKTDRKIVLLPSPVDSMDTTRSWSSPREIS